MSNIYKIALMDLRICTVKTDLKKKKQKSTLKKTLESCKKLIELSI